MRSQIMFLLNVRQPRFLYEETGVDIECSETPVIFNDKMLANCTLRD